MEFIPLEKHSSKKGKKAGKKGSPGKGEKDIKPMTIKEITTKKGKGKFQNKMMDKKKVKNKYREVVAKKGEKSSKRVPPKKKKNDEDENEEEDSLKESQETAEMDEGDEDIEEEEEENEDIEDEEEEDKEDEDEESMIEKKRENAIKEKLKKMDEKMKNRLFVKMKKKIISEAQVKNLHPDIRGVIFPRKKNSRWCWAVFVSQEKALAALKQLVKNSEVLVTKPNPRDRVEKKREEKLKTVQRRKENRKKLQQMWT